MSKRTLDRTAPFQSIRNAAELTGLSAGSIRAGCRAGTVPHIMQGKEYRVNVPLFLQQLDMASAASLRGGNT